MQHQLFVRGINLAEESWSEGASVFQVIDTPVDNGDGAETVTVRFTADVSGAGFARQKLMSVP